MTGGEILPGVVTENWKEFIFSKVSSEAQSITLKIPMTSTVPVLALALRVETMLFVAALPKEPK
jgi:hypothetical protein